MKKPNIIIAKNDHARLLDLIAMGNGFSFRDREGARELKRELERAQVVPPHRIPTDAITLNRRAELLDLDADERLEYTIVMPGEADIMENRISVLAPIGTGMLGYRVGDVFTQATPRGTRRLKVLAVHFQPEAARATDEGASMPQFRTMPV